MQVPANRSGNAPPRSLLPISTTPISTHRLAQKDPSRKPNVGPNIPEDLTRPARDGRQQGRVSTTLRGQALLLHGRHGKEGGRRRPKRGTGHWGTSNRKLLTSKKISHKLPTR